MTPSGWSRGRLGDLTEIVNGSTPRTSSPAFWGGDIPWVTPDDLSRNRAKTVHGGLRSLTREGYESCSTRLLPPGAVLFTSRAPIGYVAIAGGPVCTNQGFKSFVPSGALLSDYLYWALVHLTPAIREMGTGTTFPEVSKKKAAEIVVAVPPVNEQRRIVAATEEQFSRLDAADAPLRLVRARGDRFAASVVGAATGGVRGPCEASGI